mgnify:CR=1 FL=1
MKKFFVTLVVIFFLIILDIFLSRIFPYYLRPNLWIVYTIFVSLFLGHIDAVITGFFAGAIYDVLHLSFFGVNTLLLTTIGYTFGWLNKRVDETLYSVQILSVFLSFIVYHCLHYIVMLIFLGIKQYNFINLLSIITTFIIGFLEIQLLILFYKKYKLL